MRGSSRLIYLCLAVGCVLLLGACRSGKGTSQKEYAESVLRVAGAITGSILVMPIQKDLDVDYGFGLYTTILFTKTHPERNLEFIKALEQVPQHTVNSLKREERVQKNAFFMPSNAASLGYCLSHLGIPGLKNANDTIFHLSKNGETRNDFYHLMYSYEIAEEWLEVLRNKRFKLGRGPILITSPAPISKMAGEEAFLIVTDLSSTSEKLFKSYVHVLVDELKKPSTWEKQQVDSLALSFANQVAGFDQAIRESLRSLGGLVQVVQAAGSGEVPVPKIKELPRAAVASCTRLKPFIPN